MPSILPVNIQANSSIILFILLLRRNDNLLKCQAKFNTDQIKHNHFLLYFCITRFWCTSAFITRLKCTKNTTQNPNVLWNHFGLLKKKFPLLKLFPKSYGFFLKRSGALVLICAYAWKYKNNSCVKCILMLIFFVQGTSKQWGTEIGPI